MSEEASKLMVLHDGLRSSGLLLDAYEAQKQPPAPKPASPIAQSTLTDGDKMELLDRARRWEDA